MLSDSVGARTSISVMENDNNNTNTSNNNGGLSTAPTATVLQKYAFGFRCETRYRPQTVTYWSSS